MLAEAPDFWAGETRPSTHVQNQRPMGAVEASAHACDAPWLARWVDRPDVQVRHGQSLVPPGMAEVSTHPKGPCILVKYIHRPQSKDVVPPLAVEKQQGPNEFQRQLVGRGAGTNHARLRRLLQRCWRHSGDTRRHPSLQGMEDPNDRLNFRSVMRLQGPEGPSTQYLRTLVPTTIKGMDFGTKIFKYWVLGPSGNYQIGATWPHPTVIPIWHTWTSTSSKTDILGLLGLEDLTCESFETLRSHLRGALDVEGMVHELVQRHLALKPLSLKLQTSDLAAQP